MRRRTVFAAGAAAAGASMLGAVDAAATSADSSTDSDDSEPTQTHLVISQVQSRSGQAGNTDAEIRNRGNALEVANPTINAVNVAGWTVRVYNSATFVTAEFTFPAGTVTPVGGFALVRDADYLPCPRDPRLTLIFTFAPLSGPDEIPDLFGAELLNAGGGRVDSVATVLGIPGVGEGMPAVGLTPGTDPCCASLRRDCLLTDSNNNAVDFQRRPAAWGTVIR